MRKYFIDNLRRISVLLLLPYHTCMIYNNFGENFYVKSDGIPLLSGFIQICYSWFISVWQSIIWIFRIKLQITLLKFRSQFIFFINHSSY